MTSIDRIKLEKLVSTLKMRTGLEFEITESGLLRCSTANPSTGDLNAAAKYCQRHGYDITMNAKLEITIKP